MKNRVTFIISFLLSLNFAYSQLSENKYIEKCDYTIKYLAEKTNNKEKWISKFDSINVEYVKIGNEKSKSKKFYSDDVNSLYSFQYLKTIYSYLLPKKTDLSNEIGRQLMSEEIDSLLSKKLDSISTIFENYSNTENASKFQSLYNQYLNIKNSYIEKKSDFEVLYRHLYESVDNAYAQPSSIKEFMIYDWEKAISELKILNKKSDNLIAELKSVKYSIIKEPLPYIPLIFQFATLLILVSNLLVNFGFEAKTNKIIRNLVILSIATSLVLLFLSSNTILNTLINVFIPGIMYLIYYKKQKKTMANTV